LGLHHHGLLLGIIMGAIGMVRIIRP